MSVFELMAVILMVVVVALVALTIAWGLLRAAWWLVGLLFYGLLWLLAPRSVWRAMHHARK